MPSVHYSSFEARLALTRAEEEESGDAAILGFLDQTRNVLVGVDAALERAATERWSTVLEGVHLVPAWSARSIPARSSSSASSRSRTRTSTAATSGCATTRPKGLRPLEKYLDSLPQIREIQDYLVERARRHDVPVIVQRLARSRDRRRPRSRSAARGSARRLPVGVRASVRSAD